MSVKFNYNLDQFPFHKIIQKIFKCDNLLLIHESLPYAIEHNGFIPDMKLEPGKDQSTYYHNIFYNAIKKDDSFLILYKEFIDYIFYGNYGNVEPFLYQKIPTFRVHLPNNKAVGGRSHKDADYNHPIGETNYLVPLTTMHDSSSMFIESSPGRCDFHFISMQPGQYLRFNGNQCEHGNINNVTGYTRVSFDFRVISCADLARATESRSVAHGLRFVDGEYYVSYRKNQ